MVVLIIENNNTGKIEGPLKETNQLYKKFSIRHPDQWFLRKSMPRGWDGCLHYIKENGKFNVGLLEKIGAACDELGIEWDIADLRPDSIKPGGEILKMGKWELRDYQKAATFSLINNEVKGVKWPRGSIRAATNAGKTVISSFIHLNYSQPTIFLMNSTELFNQALEEIPQILGEKVGQISSKKIEWADFMVCMAPTTKNRIKDSQVFNKLSQYPILIVDEGDLVDNKTNKEVIRALYNTQVRVALSGTINLEIKSKKHDIKNLNIMGFFGKLLYTISNRELIDKGVSSDVQVLITKGNLTKLEVNNWQEEYDECITTNKERNKKCVKRSIEHFKAGRDNQLIIAQYHKHIIKLHKLYLSAIEKGAFGTKDIVIDWVHHDRPDRDEVVRRFRDGKIHILIGSMILKRGKNFPKMTFMLNAAGGKSPENILQLLGRAFRGCKHYEDFWDVGRYLEPHSRKRVLWYKRENIKVTIDK